MNTDRFLTPLEASRLLRISLNTVYELIGSGEIPTIRVGRQHRIPASEFAARFGLPPTEPR